MNEPFTLMGYIAAITQNLGLATGILILPQRQTALVAKQAAEVDLLSGGRLRLGIGVGWNHVEYEALGEDFHNRAAAAKSRWRSCAPCGLREVVNYAGRWHRITDAGINPPSRAASHSHLLGAGSGASPRRRTGCSAASPAWVTAGSPTSRRTRGVVRPWPDYGSVCRSTVGTPRRWASRGAFASRQAARGVGQRSQGLGRVGGRRRNRGGPSGRLVLGSRAHRRHPTFQGSGGVGAIRLLLMSLPFDKLRMSG